MIKINQAAKDVQKLQNKSFEVKMENLYLKPFLAMFSETFLKMKKV